MEYLLDFPHRCSDLPTIQPQAARFAAGWPLDVKSTVACLPFPRTYVDGICIRVYIIAPTKQTNLARRAQAPTHNDSAAGGGLYMGFYTYSNNTLSCAEVSAPSKKRVHNRFGKGCPIDSLCRDKVPFANAVRPAKKPDAEKASTHPLGDDISHSCLRVMGLSGPETCW